MDLENHAAFVLNHEIVRADVGINVHLEVEQIHLVCEEEEGLVEVLEVQLLELFLAAFERPKFQTRIGQVVIELLEVLLVVLQLEGVLVEQVSLFLVDLVFLERLGEVVELPRHRDQQQPVVVHIDLILRHQSSELIICHPEVVVRQVLYVVDLLQLVLFHFEVPLVESLEGLERLYETLIVVLEVVIDFAKLGDLVEVEHDLETDVYRELVLSPGDEVLEQEE